MSSATTLFYHCHESAESDRDFLRSSLDEFLARLREQTQVDATLQELDASLAAEVVRVLSIDPRTADAEIGEQSRIFALQQATEKLKGALADRGFVRVLFYCDPESQLARSFRAENRDWGTAFLGLAIVYKRDARAVLWHETLHTFGAIDCYDPLNPEKKTCDDVNCLMVWEPNDSIIARTPFICQRNKEQVATGGQIGEFGFSD